jgi:hypothetical protein
MADVRSALLQRLLHNLTDLLDGSPLLLEASVLYSYITMQQIHLTGCRSELMQALASSDETDDESDEEVEVNELPDSVISLLREHRLLSLSDSARCVVELHYQCHSLQRRGREQGVAVSFDCPVCDVRWGEDIRDEIVAS